MPWVRLWECEAHLLPGRLRLRLPGLLGCPRLARRTEERLGQVRGVRSIRANPETGRLLLCFDPAVVTLDDLGAQLSLPREAPPARGEALAQTVIPGAALVAVAAKRLLVGPSALSQSPAAFNLAGMLTAAASYPLLRRGLAGLLARHRLNADLFIGSASLLMALMRENVPGLTVLFLAGLNNLILSDALAASAPRLSPALARLTERAGLQAALWGRIALTAGLLTGAATRSWRRALATLIAAAPAAPALSAALPLGTAAVRARQCGGAGRGDPVVAELTARAVRTVAQNQLLLTALNTAGLALAATGAVTPLGAGLWHSLTSLAVQFNAMKLLRHPV